MAVREYKARSIQAAVSRIKKDLGPNAMILSLKRVPKGSLDPYGSDMFEVLALSTKEQGEKIGRHNGRHAEHYTGQTDRQAGHYTTGQTDRHTERYAIGPKDRHAEHYAGQTDRQTDRHNGHTDYHNDRRIEKTALASQGVIVESPQKKNAGDGLQEIRDELVSMKDMLKFIDQAKGIPGFLQQHPECISLYTRMMKAGVSQKRTQDFLQKGCSAQGGGSPALNTVAESVLKDIYASITVQNPFETSSKKRNIAALIGPTGVGKTTTIAKLAAYLSLKQKKKVGLISLDGYRIGAVDQLKTYASIMGLPCLSAFNKKDIKQAVVKLGGKDIILIDTPGQSHLDKEKMRGLTDLVKGEMAISSHLVLSVTIKSMDMKEAAEKFSCMEPKSYIFSKVDETRKLGGIIDQVLNLNLPVSFITNGQKVPDDILLASKKMISQMVFNRWINGNGKKRNDLIMSSNN